MDRLRGMKISITPGGGRQTTAYGRALIAAALGERATAVALLQQAFAEGIISSRTCEIEFQMIKYYPPLKELLWPKG